MLQIATYQPSEVFGKSANTCADLLCRQGSEMQAVFSKIAAGAYQDQGDGLTLALASKLEEDSVVIGWASIALWNGSPSIQASVSEEYRRRGLASAMVTAIVCDMPMPLDHVHVFSPHLIGPAKRAGFKAVTEWQRVQDGWLKRSEQ